MTERLPPAPSVAALPRRIAGAAVTLAILGIVAVLRSGASDDSRAKPRGDPVAIVQVVPSAPVAPPIAAPREDRDSSLAVVPTQDAPILHALALPAGTLLRNVATTDPAQRIICGEVAASPTAPGRRFVYLGVAGLAAIDDDGAEFAQMRERLCTHRAALRER